MWKKMKMAITLLAKSWAIAAWLLLRFDESQGQQTYVNNQQLDCTVNYTSTLGYVCNGPATNPATGCPAYLTFRSTPTFNTAVSIGYLLNADPSEIAQTNNISNFDPIPPYTLVIVPVNCSCFRPSQPPPATAGFYQHNASYTLNAQSETYFIVANVTYQGLSTCQSLANQNPYDYRELLVGMRLNVPLRCACPTANQTAAGIRYLLTYIITWRDTVSAIGQTFGNTTEQTILEANQLSENDLIFPFTPILVPLRTLPTNIHTAAPPPPPPELPSVVVGGGNSSDHKWVFVGVGVGAALLVVVSLSGFLVWFFRGRRRRQPSPSPSPTSSPQGKQRSMPKTEENVESSDDDFKSWSISPEGVRYAIESLTVYRYEELEIATGFFAESNRIKGSVYKASFKGDEAAVKMMRGDVSSEINILKHINHSNIIRLSGLCLHEGNTYLVYEYGENGSLSDWLHHDKKKTKTQPLGWKQRVQIAYDVADALNYLHNYTNPPYVHKNLKSSNVLLDGNMRAKVSNFGLAKTLHEDFSANGGLQVMTRHVVGTYGYMAPEYIENGLITPKLDVFAFGVVVLELLSGLDGGWNNEEGLLSERINEILAGENVREKMGGFLDPVMGKEYPLDLAYSMAQLARNCVARDLNARPSMPEIFVTLSKILSSSMDWDPSFELQNS